MHKRLFFILISLLIVIQLQAQDSTLIPDPNFEQALIDLNIDSDTIINGWVLTSEINSLTELNVFNYDIDSLNGIEAFDSLRTLNCSNNSIRNIDVSQNLKLADLNCSSNLLDSLRINDNVLLEILSCQNNSILRLDVSNNSQLKKLDFSLNRIDTIYLSNQNYLENLNCSNNRLHYLNIDNNTQLKELNCSGNQLQMLNVSNNNSIQQLFCSSNKINSLSGLGLDSLLYFDCSSNLLKELDVSNDIYLINIFCSGNQFTNLDVSKNDSLSFLTCSDNQLETLDVSQNLKLEYLICASNLLTSLDIDSNSILLNLDLSGNLVTSLDAHNNSTLTSLNCSNNQLEFLDINNGRNDTLNTFNSINNPILYCIKVDDTTAINSKTDWQKDDFAIYNEECYQVTYIPDDNFEAALIDYDDIPNDDFIPTANIENLTYLDVRNESISDLTGIEDFINLDSLDCSQNQLYNLNMSNQPNLVKLNCSSNNLNALVLKNIPTGILTHMDATGNPFLTCINVDSVAAAVAEPNWLEDDPAFYNLDCSTNKTYVPDDNFEQALIDLGYDHGGLDNYVITDSINIVTSLDLSDRNIFDLTGIENFIALDSLDCSMNKLMTLDVSANVDLLKLSCYSNYLTNLDVDNNTLLLKLFCGDNKLDSIDVSLNVSLKQLSCDANQLTGIDVSNNADLQVLNCNSNYITNVGLDVSINTNLKQLFSANNQLTSIDITNNTLLEDLDCSNNQLTQLDLTQNRGLYSLDCSNNNISNLDLTADTVLVSINCNSNQLIDLDFNDNPLLRGISCNNNVLTSIDVSSNDSLRELSVSNNKLPQVIVDNNILLRSLQIGNNQLDSLILTSNDSLRVLLCANNNINDLNLSNNLFLNTLYCDNNNIDSLNISDNDSFIELSCSKNNLQIIDISSNLLIRELIIDENQLTDLDVSANDSLRKVSCSSNELSSLNFSNNTFLTSLTCSSNQLASLNVQNGNNAILETFYSSNNPNLTCIEIDNTSNIGASWQKDEIASFTENCHYSESYIPDDNFEAALSVILSEPSNNDNYIPTAGIEVLTSLDISNQSITDLTGIQDFVDLSSLIVSGNPIDSLDLSQNFNLLSLVCANMQIDSLDLSYNIALEQLDFSNNQLTEIDLSNLVSLTSLTCIGNDIINLDITFNTDLTSLNCSGNQLISINVKNGNNVVLTVFNATNNLDLECIEVDDPTSANSSTGAYASWQVDGSVLFNDNCHYGQTYVPDDAFEQALKDLGYDNSSTEPLDDYVPTNKIDFRTSLGISNKGISDLTGIEGFTNLVTLNCENNNLTVLNFINNLALENLLCSGNQLDSIEVSLNTALSKLEVNDNLLLTIDLSGNSFLEILDCSSNQLTSLSITNNTMLKSINCSLNQLVSVDANNGANDIITNFDLRDNPNLRCILVDDISAASGYSGWYKDVWASYKFECNDDDNDGVVDLVDLCINTPFGDLVDVFGCSIFMLATDNFSIITKSETCRGGNNGIVCISALEILNYTATLIGMEDTIIHLFTDSIEIKNIRAGTYELCISLEEEPGYSQYYDLVITEPDDFVVQSTMSPEGNNVSLIMSGGTVYEIDFNGLVYSTSDSEIRLFLEKGKNTLSIKTELDCQGVYKEILFLAEDPIVYPNPFNDYFDLYLGKDDTNANVKIYSSLGNLIWTKRYINQNGLIRINTSNMARGVYYVSLEFETYRTTLKIIKE